MSVPSASKLLRAAIVLASLGTATAAWAQANVSPYTSGVRYDNERRVTGTIAADPDGAGPLGRAAQRNSYDAAGRLVKTETGWLSVWQPVEVAPLAWPGFNVTTTTEYVYDAFDRKVLERSRGGQTGDYLSATQFSYDVDGRLECTAVRMNPAAFVSLPASACELGPTGAQGPDRITRSVYDAAGQLLITQKAYRITTANGFPQTLQQNYATYTYSANGKRTSLTDANGNKASMTYDGHDRQVKWNFPSKTSPGAVSDIDFEAYTYDANGNRLTLRKRDGATLTYQYDNLNRVVQKIVPERAETGPGVTLDPIHTRDVFYGYDLQGRVIYTRFDSPNGEGITNGYDAFGRPTSTTKTMNGSWVIGRGFDANGNRTGLIYPDGLGVWASFNQADNVANMWHGSTWIEVNAYDNDGRRIWRDNANGMRSDYGYDPLGRLSSLSNNFYNNATQGQSNKLYTFAYNAANQITARSSANGNFAWTAHYNVNRSYATNGLNQYTSAGPATFNYDANGNLNSDGSTSYTYDVENRLVSASGATNATLRYDPLGRLHEVTSQAGTTRFVYDGDDLVMEYDGSGTLLRRYVHGPGSSGDDPIVWYEGATMPDSAMRFLRTDERGSVVVVSSASSILAINRYDEYGIPQAGNVGRFQYTGQAWLAEIGMYYYKARIYSPTLGRFLQTDPIGYEDQVNLYAYVGNDPINQTDPTGMMSDRDCQEHAGGCSVSGNDPESDKKRQKDQPPPTTAQGAQGSGEKACDFQCQIRKATAVYGEVKKVLYQPLLTTVEDYLIPNETLVIGRESDLSGLPDGERRLLKFPFQGSPKLNWAVNAALMRLEMSRGLPIKDASPGNNGGQFLNAERNLLRSRGWTFDARTNFWMPPKP